MATLVGQRITGDRRICYYRYLGRQYSRMVTPARTCPYTPHFSGE
ncbi:hypothetical protein RCO27_13485 [Sphingosinicella sp. LHD-64]|nr:hypothetical protein [Sphingosinicella sp. LHD-64]MDQ8757239.1 hypothetical protein [Sphingosinicella sp. LHD-64]